MTSESRPRLIVKGPDSKESEYLLDNGAVVIGRHASCDLALESRYVSRRHALVEPDGARWALLDISDTNPVLVNGQPVAGRHLLRPGDVIRIADVLLEFELPTEDPNSTFVFRPPTPEAVAEEAGAVRPARPAWLEGLRGTCTIMFTDLQDSTRITADLGDVPAQEYMRTHNRLLREEFERFNGFEVKGLGDGFMVAFASASAAAHCAIRIQRRLSAHNESNDHPILVRIGLNVGEVIAEEDDIFGTAVILASRVMAEAGAGEVCLSGLMERVLAVTGEFEIAPAGTATLKGFEEPQQLWRLEWDGAGEESVRDGD